MRTLSGRLVFLSLSIALGIGAASAEPWYGQYDYGYSPAYPMPEPMEAQPPAYEPPAYQPPEAAVVAPQPPAARAVATVSQALSPDFAELANQPVLPQALKRTEKSDPQIARLQILLDRAHASPGAVDGLIGGNLSKAISALQNMAGLPSTGHLGPQIDELLAPYAQAPVLVPYAIAPEDVAGPFVPIMPHDYAEVAKLDWLGYRDPAEGLAEKFHMDEGFLRRLNPHANFSAVGSTILVADVGPPAKIKVAHLVADTNVRQLLGYDEAWNLVVAYPATIGSADMPSPTGIHAVKAIAVNPIYWYRPQVNFQQGNNTKALKLAPGPNNPVGAVWIGLDKPTYGIHGSPEPSKIDKTNSHGCVRLTNWDAKELAKLVHPGVDVEFVDPTTTASVAQVQAPAPAPLQPAQ